MVSLGSLLTGWVKLPKLTIRESIRNLGHLNTFPTPILIMCIYVFLRVGLYV